MKKDNTKKQNRIRERVSDIDVFRGMLMLFVMLAHSITGLDNFPNKFLSSFHMPAFFFVSGMVSRGGYLSKIKGFGYPLITFSIIAIIINLITIAVVGNERAIDCCISYNGSIIDMFSGIIICGIGYLPTPGFWYVQDVFYISLLYIFLSRKNVPNWIIACVTLCLFVIFYRFPDFQFRRVLIRMSCGGFFFAVGSIYYKHIYARVKSIIETKRPLFCLIAVLTIITTALLAQLNAPVLMALNVYGRVHLFFIIALCGSFSIALLSLVIKHNKFLEYIGRNCILFLFFHFYFLQIARYVTGNATTPLYFMLYFLFALICCFPTAHIMSKYFKWYYKWPLK